MTNDFNPRPRKEGDKPISSIRHTRTALISIHALVKRATTVPNGRCTSPVISIHALVKRATSADGVLSGWKFISIHALVKRATNL